MILENHFIENYFKAPPPDAYFVTYPLKSSFLPQVSTLSYMRTILTGIFSSTFFSHQDLTEANKNALLEMGIQDPESFYQTSQKTAKTILRLFALFKQKDLRLTYDLSKKELIASDSSFLEINEIRTIFLQIYPLDKFPFFHMQNQTLCSRLNGLAPSTPLSIPELKNWTNHLKQTPKALLKDFQTVRLPSGNTYSQKSFVEHPLFKYTLERYNVFRFLGSFIEKEGFHERYDTFLQNIAKENWISFYLSDPKSLACLSLIAFLEDQIKQEDLFVIHMAASALEESSQKAPVTFTVLTLKNAKDFLTQAQYPPFAPSSFYTDKSKKELEIQSQNCIANLKDKTPLQRTAITYMSSPGSIEQKIHLLKWKIGYNNTSYSKTALSPPITLLHPKLCLELYEAASSLKTPPPSDHTWMFGYNNDKESLTALSKGRPISVASPLFKIPYVHEFVIGKQLGITMHDMLYHVALDWQNPHTRQFIELGQALFNQPHQTKDTKRIGIKLLDREATGYTTRNYALEHRHKKTETLLAFWITVAKWVTEGKTFVTTYKELISEIPMIPLSLLQSTLPPDFLDPKSFSLILTIAKKMDIEELSALFLTDLGAKIKAHQMQFTVNSLKGECNDL